MTHMKQGKYTVLFPCMHTLLVLLLCLVGACLSATPGHAQDSQIFASGKGLDAYVFNYAGNKLIAKFPNVNPSTAALTLQSGQSPIPWMPNLSNEGYIIDFKGYLEYQPTTLSPYSLYQSPTADFFLFQANNSSGTQVWVYLDNEIIYASPDQTITSYDCEGDMLVRDSDLLLQTDWMVGESFYTVEIMVVKAPGSPASSLLSGFTFGITNQNPDVIHPDYFWNNVVPDPSGDGGYLWNGPEPYPELRPYQYLLFV